MPIPRELVMLEVGVQNRPIQHFRKRTQIAEVHVNQSAVHQCAQLAEREFRTASMGGVEGHRQIMAIGERPQRHGIV